jgi:hypothetical protein
MFVTCQAVVNVAKCDWIQFIGAMIYICTSIVGVICDACCRP